MRDSNTQAETYGDLSPDQFRSTIDESWEAARKIKDSVAEQVESQKLSPLQGAAIVACTVGQVFGYREFHGEVSPAQLALAQRL